MSVQAQGLFSGAGGDLIAQELLRRQTNTGGSDIGDSVLGMIPQVMQAAGVAQYQKALGQKAQAEAQAIAVKQSARQNVANLMKQQFGNAGHGDILGSMLEGDLISGSDALNAMQAASQTESGYQIGRVEQSRNPNYAGGDLFGKDPLLLKAIAQNAGGDPVKMKAIAKQLEDNHDYSIVHENIDLAGSIMDRFEESLYDPKIIELAKASGMPESAIPDFIFSKMLESDQDLNKSPQLKQVLMKRYVDTGLEGLQQFGYDIQKRQLEFEKAKADTMKKQAETDKAQATAAKYDAEANILIPAKAATEGTKQAKNLRPPAPRGGGSGGGKKPAEGSNMQLNDAQRVSLEKDILKLDTAIAKAAAIPTPTNKKILPVLQKNKQQLQQRLSSGAVPTGQSQQQKPAGFFGGNLNKALKFIGD